MDLDANRNLIAAALGRIPGGDRAALQTVYRLTSAKLFGVALRILGERSEAEDVLQEVYVTVWRKAADFDAKPGKPDDLADRDRAQPRHRPAARHRARAGAWNRSSRPTTVPDGAAAADSALESAQDHARLHGCLDGLASA